MTFAQWCKQTARECDSALTYPIVKMIMVTALRVMLEELLSNPAEADLDIMGFFRIYLNHRVVHNNFAPDPREEYATYWTAHCKFTRKFKEVINGKHDPKMLVIGNELPLYPEYYHKDKAKCKKKTIKIVNNRCVIVEEVDKKALRKLLPEEDV